MKNASKTQLAVVTLVGAMFFAGTSWATTINPAPTGEDDLQDIVNGITGDTSINVNTDQVSPDETFFSGATGGSFNKIFAEEAGNADFNEFGIYDPLDMDMVAVFNGSDGVGAEAVFAFDDADNSVITGPVPGSTVDTNVIFGDTFGFYLDGPGGIFYSQPAKNSDASDHMVSFVGPAGALFANEYILAFEDVAFPGADGDYNDFVAVVESIKPVPVPAAVWLMGSALVMLVGIGRRRRSPVVSA